MILRAYESSDCPSIAELFYNTIHTVNAKDYSSEQLDAWATGQVDLAAWDVSFLAHRTIVAVEDGRIIGFGTWTAPAIWTACMSTKTAKGGESPPESAMFWNKPPRLSISPPMPPSLPGHSLSGAAGESSGSSR